MLEPGHILQRRFAIERVLGQGGMGSVYLARHLGLGGRPLAIKEMMVTIADATQRAQAVSQFQREAEIVAALEHPNLVRVQDFFEEAGQQYLVMDYVDGPTLEDVVIEHDGFIPTARVYDWAEQILNVLQYLHSHVPPVLFRDLKPSNIMQDARGQIRLIDFGIARVLDTNTQTSTFIHGAGTAGFAPVEQYTGTTDARSDVYAAGATFYMLLTRVIPPMSIALMSGEAKLLSPRGLNPALSIGMEACLLKMMALRREDRFGSATEAAVALLEARRFEGGTPCPQCGQSLLAGASFCSACGTRYGAQSTARPPVDGGATLRPPSGGSGATVEHAVPPLEPTLRTPVVPAGRPGLSRRHLLGGALILLAALLFGVGLHQAQNGSGSPTPIPSPTANREAVATPTPPPQTVVPTPTPAAQDALRAQIEARYAAQSAAVENHRVGDFMATLSPEYQTRSVDGTVDDYDDTRTKLAKLFDSMSSGSFRVTIDSLSADGPNTVRCEAELTLDASVQGDDNVTHTVHIVSTVRDTWVRSADGWLEINSNEERTTTSKDGQVVSP